jgi:hypothetical protein
MAVYAISDLHLSLASDKYDGYLSRMAGLCTIKLKKTGRYTSCRRIPWWWRGDISWAMNLQESVQDFTFLTPSSRAENPAQRQPRLLVGRPKSKLEAFLAANGLNSIEILHNNSIAAGISTSAAAEAGFLMAAHLRMLKLLQERLQGFKLLYPARRMTAGKGGVSALSARIWQRNFTEILDVLYQYNIKRCYYGHIHGAGANSAMNGEYQGIRYRLISSDFINFAPIKVD